MTAIAPLLAAIDPDLIKFIAWRGNPVRKIRL